MKTRYVSALKIKPDYANTHEAIGLIDLQRQQVDQALFHQGIDQNAAAGLRP